MAPFTLGTLGSLPMQPLFTGPLLLALLSRPEAIQQLVPEGAHNFLFSEGLLKTLKYLFGFGLLRAASRTLSELALNNFTNDKTWDWKNEIVLVTGGSSGIGEQMVLRFAAVSAKVIVLDLQASKKPLPPNVFFYKINITDAAAVHAVAAQIRADHGNPSVLVNNAGIGYLRTVLNASIDDVRRVFEVNTISHFTMVKEFLPAMIERNHGHVVTIASMASYIAVAQNVDYHCSKASALAFHEGLTAELSNRYHAKKVRTTVVHPSWVRTPMIEPLLATGSFRAPIMEVEYVADRIVNQVLSGRSGHLILPDSLGFSTGMRGWPYWLQVFARNSMSKELS